MLKLDGLVGNVVQISLPQWRRRVSMLEGVLFSLSRAEASQG
jgi:hypothetical protein